MQRPLQVLVIDEEIPLPVNAGKRVRTWNLLRRTAQQHQVHLLCYGNESVEADQVRAAGVHLHLVSPLRQPGRMELVARLLGNQFSGWPYSVQKHHTERFRNAICHLQERYAFDLIQCEWTPYASFRSCFGDTPWIISTHNIEADIWERRAESTRNPAGRIFFQGQARKMARFETAVFAAAGGLGAVSEHDAARMRRRSSAPVQVVDNGVDLEGFQPSTDYHDLHVMYLGSLDWHPNVDAVEHLVREIWPRVIRVRPQTRLEIVGRRPSESMRQWLEAAPGVTLHSDVADVRPLLAHSILAVPLRIGGGTRIKILEAMGMARPVVSSRIGAEGLEVRDAEEAFLADATADFADRLLSLLESPETARIVGSGARRLVETRYGWDRSAGLLMDLWSTVTQITPLPRAVFDGGEKVQASTR